VHAEAVTAPDDGTAVPASDAPAAPPSDAAAVGPSAPEADAAADVGDTSVSASPGAAEAGAMAPSPPLSAAPTAGEPRLTARVPWLEPVREDDLYDEADLFEEPRVRHPTGYDQIPSLDATRIDEPAFDPKSTPMREAGFGAADIVLPTGQTPPKPPPILESGTLSRPASHPVELSGAPPARSSQRTAPRGAPPRARTRPSTQGRPSVRRRRSRTPT
jgi:hypothetical protein